MKAKHCDQCKYFHHPSELRPKAGCQKGHKPRFYAPDTAFAPSNDWGWKRRCIDFEEQK